VNRPRRTLRWQLTLPFIAFTACAIVAASLGVQQLLLRAVWSPLDSAFREEAETLLLLRRTTDLSAFQQAVREVGAEREWHTSGKFVRAWSAAGELIAQGGSPPEHVDRIEPRDGPRLFDEGPGAYRVLRYTAPGGASIEIGARVDHQFGALRHVRIGIVAGAIGLLTVLSLLGWATTSKATAELERLAAELETLEAGSLDRRLPPQHTVEVDRLASVLNRLLARLEAALGHLRRFTSDAAHELRTPIASLRTHIEISLARGATLEETRHGLIDALEQTERLANLAEELLTLSVVESGGGPYDMSGTVDLVTTAAEVVEFLEPVAQEQEREFEYRSETDVRVRGSADLLKRLMVILVDNGFRHTPPSAAVRLAVRSTDGRAIVEVSDSGPGIPSAELPWVFERFRRGSSPAAGTGIGLALAREIVTLHQGHIALASSVEGGTTVTVTLPRLQPVAGS
jgi:signal transduction histidine kinase